MADLSGEFVPSVTFNFLQGEQGPLDTPTKEVGWGDNSQAILGPMTAQAWASTSNATISTTYRGRLNGVYVYSVDTPPVGASDITIIKSG